MYFEGKPRPCCSRMAVACRDHRATSAALPSGFSPEACLWCGFRSSVRQRWFCEGKGLLQGSGGALAVCWLALAWELGGLGSCLSSGTNEVSTPAMVTSKVGTPSLCLLNRGGV